MKRSPGRGAPEQLLFETATLEVYNKMATIRSREVGYALIFYDEDTGTDLVGIDASTLAVDIKAGGKFTVAGVDKTPIVSGGPGSVPTAALAAGAATLPKVSFAGIKVLSAAGVAAAGAIALAGTAVGDRLVAVFGTLTAGGALVAKVPGTDFQSVVSVINQIQQLVAADLHLSTFIFILAPATA